MAALAIVVASWFAWGPMLRGLFAPTSELVGTSTESFNGGLLERGRVESTGYFVSPDGFCLNPDQSGSLVYRVLAPSKFTAAHLWFYQPAGGTNRVSLSTDGGQTWRVLAENRQMVAEPLELGDVPPQQDLLLKFEATNRSPNQALVLDELHVAFRSGPLTTLPPLRTVVLIVMSFGLAVVVLCRRWALALSTLLILAVGAELRYEAGHLLVDAALDPDAIGYRQYVSTMRLFSETGFFSAAFGIREPGFILAAHLYSSVFGSSDFGLRLMTIILSTIAIWAVLRVGRGLFGVMPGQVIGLIVALNPPLIQESVRGLRLELEIVLFMAYVYLAIIKQWPKVLPAAVVTSLVAGLLVSTRSTYLTPILALNALALYRPGTFKTWVTAKTWVAAMIVTVAILAAFIVPHRYNMHRLYGDAFLDTAVYARWCANVEFVGQPGFPTAEELQKDAATGPRITYGHYLFGLHTPWEVAVGTARGFWKLFRRMEIASMNPPKPGSVELNAGFQALAAGGMIVALWFRNYRWIPVAFVLIELLASFLYDRRLVEFYRHTYSGFPLVLFASFVPLAAGWEMVAARRRRLVAVPSMAT